MQTHSKPLTKNAGNKSQVKDAREIEKIRREVEINDLRFVLKHKEGRRFMWRLLSECGLYRDLSPTMTEAEVRDAIGRRSVALFLIGEINEADETAYKRMQEEQQQAQKKGDQ